MSFVRCRAVAQRHAFFVSRPFSASSRVRADAAGTASPNLGSVSPPKQPIGGFRGGCVLRDYLGNALVCLTICLLQNLWIPARILVGVVFRGISPTRRVQGGVGRVAGKRAGAPGEHREGMPICARDMVYMPYCAPSAVGDGTCATYRGGREGSQGLVKYSLKQR